MKIDVNEFNSWLGSSDFLYNRLDKLASKLTEYLSTPEFSSLTEMRAIFSKFEDVLKRCDLIDYQDDHTATAYVMLHFLTRYRRFQINFLALIEKNLLPIPRRKINVLDVGTGPAPALYALSDVFNSLIQYGKERNIASLSNLEFELDYVERSQGFRNFLHHFTEKANDREGIPWKVPYHHGSFENFHGISFDESYQIIDAKRLIVRNVNRKHRYDIAILSNFLTSEHQVDGLTGELQTCMRYLRNNGILTIVGGTGGKYPNVYHKVDHTLLGVDYSNYKFKANCHKVDIGDMFTMMSSDKFFDRIKVFNSQVISMFATHKVLIPPTKERNPKWSFIVYRKNARMRRGIIKRFERY